jgi:hypothetical protein
MKDESVVTCMYCVSIFLEELKKKIGRIASAWNRSQNWNLQNTKQKNIQPQ